MVTGVIYRPPSENTLEFIEKLNEIISGVTKGNKHCYITGDFNLDLLKHESHSVTAQFIESLFAFSFLPMITKPTRITAHSATLIDNIFTNNTTVSSKNGLIISDISDHLPIFSIVFGDYLRKDSNSFTIRDTSEIRVNEFRLKLENTNWDFSDQANSANDPNAAYNIFIDKYNGLFDTCFPFKTVKGKVLNSFRKPWLTNSFLRSINKKNKRITYRNKLTNLLRVAKRLYFQNQIEIKNTNIKQTWRILNNAIGQNKKKKLTYPLVDENGESITSTEKVANKFCKYFTNIGPNLADKIAPASKSFQDFINSVPSDSLSSFNHVTAEELKSIAKGFKDGKAPGADNIPISIIKKTLDLISDPLLSIINLSLSSGVFPDRLKISKIIPIFKSDKASLAQNYRPISILPAFSKIFERAVNRSRNTAIKIGSMWHHWDSPSMDN